MPFSFETVSASPVAGPLTRSSLSKPDVPKQRIEKMMKFGFDWARFFLVGHRIVTAFKGKEEVPLPASN